MGAQSVLLSDTVAKTRRPELDGSGVPRPARDGRPDDRRPARGACRPHHRRHDGGDRSARARRLCPPASRCRGSSLRPCGSVVAKLQTRRRVIPAVGRSTARLHEHYDDRQLALVVDYLTRALALAADHVAWLQTQRPLAQRKTRAPAIARESTPPSTAQILRT